MILSNLLFQVSRLGKAQLVSGIVHAKFHSRSDCVKLLDGRLIPNVPSQSMECLPDLSSQQEIAPDCSPSCTN